MRHEVQLYINQHPEIKQFIRNNPMWYRYLSRNPESVIQLEQEVKHFYGKTFPQKIERFQSNLNMAMMLLDMIRGMNASK